MLDNGYEWKEHCENSENQETQRAGEREVPGGVTPAQMLPATVPAGEAGGATAGERPRRKMRTVVCCLLAGAMLGAGILYGVVQIPGAAAQVNLSSRTVQQVSVTAIDGSAKLSTAENYASNVNSVVSINCSGAATNYFGQSVPYASSGSGFILTNDGSS